MSVHASGQSSFAVTAIAVGLAFFGLTLLGLSIAYAQDMTLIVNAPFEVWSALCGQPTDNPVILPVLVCVSLISILAGGTLFGVNLIRARL
jgi:hypothetical protein